jgi:hypothetical protein
LRCKNYTFDGGELQEMEMPDWSDAASEVRHSEDLAEQ